MGAIEKAVDGGAGPTLYNIEESDIDTLYKSHLFSFVSSCWLGVAWGRGRAGLVAARIQAKNSREGEALC